MEEDFQRLVERVGTLPGVRRQAHQNLINQFDAVHQSSVAASMVRRGKWRISQFYTCSALESQDAHLRSLDHFARITHALDDIEQKYAELSDVRAMVGSLRDRIETGVKIS